jgi:hypothetical protein
MKKRFLICLLLVLGWNSLGTDVWAIDVKWMQKGVRVWYLGGVGTTMTSNAEEAYLFGTVNGHDIQLTKYSAIDHWGSPNLPETDTYSRIDKGLCWIHPQVLQNIKSGDFWMGQEIVTVMPGSYTYDTFPYHLLPIKALFDLKPQRDMVKLVYMIEGFSTGIAYFDADTGICLLYETSNGLTTVFFILSEINYDFAAQIAFVEDDGPHTGFKSFVSEQSLGKSGIGGGSLIIQSLVETRYGDSVEMRVLSSDTKTGLKQGDENYCFFGSIPVVRRMDATEAPNYPPEQWNEYGKYLWWWVPPTALGNSTINIFDVLMAKSPTQPFTFTANTQPLGLFFTKLLFGADGYMTVFSAKDSETGLVLDPSDDIFQNLTTVNGLSYYRNNMGTAVPDANPNVEPDIITPETSTTPDTAASDSGGGGGGGGGCFIATAA